MRTKFSNETARRVYKERRDFVVIRCKRKTRDFVQSPDQYLIASTKHSAIGNSGVETAGRFAAEYQSALGSSSQGSPWSSQIRGRVPAGTSEVVVTDDFIGDGAVWLVSFVTAVDYGASTDQPVDEHIALTTRAAVCDAVDFINIGAFVTLSLYCTAGCNITCNVHITSTYEIFTDLRISVVYHKCWPLYTSLLLTHSPLSLTSVHNCTSAMSTECRRSTHTWSGPSIWPSISHQTGATAISLASSTLQNYLQDCHFNVLCFTSSLSSIPSGTNHLQRLWPWSSLPALDNISCCHRSAHTDTTSEYTCATKTSVMTVFSVNSKRFGFSVVRGAMRHQD